MGESGAKRMLAAGVVWVLIAGAAAGVYRFFSARGARQEIAQVTHQYAQVSEEATQFKLTPRPVPPDADAATVRSMITELQQQIEQARLIIITSATPRTPQTSHQVKLALDSFSGYCVLRSKEFLSELADQGIQLELVDDKADYAQRLKSLQSGETPLAAFTIDALIKHSASLGTMPATIVMLIDETRGADAMVAYKQAVPNVEALNREDARIVLTRDSPSETLLRVVQADFSLPALRADHWVEARDAADVYRRFRDAVASQPQAFVLWEPYVSKVLEQPDAHVVVDSSKFKGIIVDVLVAERRYLLDNPDRVVAIVKAYLSALFNCQRQSAGMVRLVRSDAASFGEQLTEQQAAQLVKGIWWKNTLENFAHFGILSGSESQGLEHVEDMVRKITAVLIKTGAVHGDPTDGSPNQLYYKSIFAQLQRENFHPSQTLAGKGESIRKEADLPALSDEEWNQLLPVGTLQVDPISFATGSAELLEPGRAALSNLVSSLKTWPQYYLSVHGRARPEGDPEANRQLAMRRAEAARNYLAEKDIPPARMHTQANVEPSGSGGRGQSVSFRLLQKRY
ncbi:MAG: OmpA family protein [Planctomycetes bacterium]|nr:OmpA family protein [Planctomycetota bacterium]